MPIDWGKILDAAGDFSQTAGATAGGRAQGRLAEAGANMQGANLDLLRKKYLNSAPAAFAGQSAISDLVNNAGDFKLNVPGVNTSSTGGLRPSALGANAKDAATALGASARARMAELPTSSSAGGGSYFGNSPDLLPQPNAMDKILSTAGTLGQAAPLIKAFLPAAAKAAAGAGIGSVIGGGTGTAASLLPAGVSAIGGGTSAGAAGTAGAFGGIGAAGAATLGIGAGAAAIAYAIKRHQNATKGDRNQFAKDAGFPDIAAFNNYLSTLGPAGQAAREYGENVVGKHNKQQEAQWLQMVQDAVSQAGKAPLPTVNRNPITGMVK